ncbi:serine protease inhibitor swm-1-like [Cotesia glomerata]|nr:serine protease inhibitor swm-1-like [Cotesia glomerata]
MNKIIVLSITICVQIISAQIMHNCGEGEAVLFCGRMCEATCQTPYITEECKHTDCLIGGCGCDFDNGFVRSNNSDKCIQKTDC